MCVISNSEGRPNKELFCGQMIITASVVEKTKCDHFFPQRFLQSFLRGEIGYRILSEDGVVRPVSFNYRGEN